MAVRASTAAEPCPRRSRDRACPVRTCIGCRERAAATELLRVVVVHGADAASPAIVPDPRRRAPGRGAWLHHDPRCVELAGRRRAFARALRVPVATDFSAVVEYVAGATRSSGRRNP